MNNYSPIWPAQLDHLCINSDTPDQLAKFYCAALGFACHELAEQQYLLQAPGRRLLIVPGRAGQRSYHGFRLAHVEQLQALADFLSAKNIATEPSPSLIFNDDALAVRDPDGWLTVFGLVRSDLPAPKAFNALPARTYPARLQHVVVASTQLTAMMDFYENGLGFVPSDYVYADLEDAESKKVAFYRSDPEHHSFAVFNASQTRADHHCFETQCWNDIRDWADHLANLEIPIWWGPGRHGPGNNLFFMFKDPHGHAIEISAELEHMPREMAPRQWPLNERSLNLWGPAWMRE